MMIHSRRNSFRVKFNFAIALLLEMNALAAPLLPGRVGTPISGMAEMWPRKATIRWPRKATIRWPRKATIRWPRKATIRCPQKTWTGTGVVSELNWELLIQKSKD